MDRFNGTIFSFYKICKMRKRKRIFTVWYVTWCICYCEQHFSGINAGYPMWPWPRTSRENFTPRPRSLSPTDTMRQQSGKGFLRIKKKLNQAVSFRKPFVDQCRTLLSLSLQNRCIFSLSHFLSLWNRKISLPIHKHVS